MNSIVLIPPCPTYGDSLSVIGLIYFLLKYYDKVYFYLNIDNVANRGVRIYFQRFFENSEYFNTRIFIVTPPEYEFFKNMNYNELHICNTHTAGWDKADYLLSSYATSDHYVNTANPLYNLIDIDEQYKHLPNLLLPRDTIEINHLVYYKLIGLNNNVRMDFFDYTRNIDKELDIKKEILLKFNISENEKYNIINSSNETDKNLHIKNSYKCIDINNLVDFPGVLLSLIEDAETIHLIYSSNVHLIYHCQYKHIMKRNKIYFHVWAQNRVFCPYYMLDYAWRCMTTPQLDNWNFIFTEEEAISIQ